MTREEAKAVAAAISIADGVCDDCTRRCASVLNEAKLGWRWLCEEDVPAEEAEQGRWSDPIDGDGDDLGTPVVIRCVLGEGESHPGKVNPFV